LTITSGFSINSKNALTAASRIFQSSPNNDENSLAPVTVNTPCLNARLNLLISTIGILPPADLASGPK
jgi:hypothetical protein